MRDSAMHPDTERVIERFGLAFEQARLPRIAGRVLGYLVLSAEPRTLEDLADALRISRSSASTDARLLERSGAVERVTIPGDRRDYYKVSEDLAGRIRAMWMERLLDARALLEEALITPEAGSRIVRDRLRSGARKLAAVVDAVESAGRRLRGEGEECAAAGEGSPGPA